MHKTAITSTITVLNVKSYTDFWQLSLIYWQYWGSAYFIALAATELSFKAFSLHCICLLEHSMRGEHSLYKLGSWAHFPPYQSPWYSQGASIRLKNNLTYVWPGLLRVVLLFPFWTATWDVPARKQRMGSSCYISMAAVKSPRLTWSGASNL